MVDPVKMLRTRMTNKSLRKVALEIGISAAYLSDIMRGQRRAGPKVLEALGLEKKTQTTYRTIE